MRVRACMCVPVGGGRDISFRTSSMWVRSISPHPPAQTVLPHICISDPAQVCPRGGLLYFPVRWCSPATTVRSPRCRGSSEGAKTCQGLPTAAHGSSFSLARGPYHLLILILFNCFSNFFHQSF